MRRSLLRSSSYSSILSFDPTMISPSCLVGNEEGDSTVESKEDCRDRMHSIRFIRFWSISCLISVFNTS